MIISKDTIQQKCPKIFTYFLMYAFLSFIAYKNECTSAIFVIIGLLFISESIIILLKEKLKPWIYWTLSGINITLLISLAIYTAQ